jgi:hypothetical protein
MVKPANLNAKAPASESGRYNGSQAGSREKIKTRTLKPQGCATLGAQARANAPGTIRR